MPRFIVRARGEFSLWLLFRLGLELWQQWVLSHKVPKLQCLERPVRDLQSICAMASLKDFFIRLFMVLEYSMPLQLCHQEVSDLAIVPAIL